MKTRVARYTRRLLLAGLFAIAGVADADPAVRYCQIAMEFSVNGRAIAAPSTVVELGKEVEITLTRDNMTGWQLRILADEPTVVRRAPAIPIEIAIYELVNGEPILRATPHLRIAPGQRADVDTTFGEDWGRKAHIALVANLRVDAEAPPLSGSAEDEPPPQQ